MTKNQELSKIFKEMAGFLRMDNISFKPQAYQRVARTLEGLKEDINRIYQRGGLEALMEIEGVGKSLAFKIEEYVKTGGIKDYEELKRKTPINFSEISAIEGMGAKRAKVIYQKLDVKNLKELEVAAKNHKIRELAGFGEKTEKNILEGINFLKTKRGRFLLGDVAFLAKEVIEDLQNLKEVEKISEAGSFRRKKETVGDIDILIVSKNPKKVIDFFCSRRQVAKVWGKGQTKASVRMADGFDIDLRVVSQKSYGSALQYFTGSKEHNVATRRIAMEKGLKLNEYGLFKGKKQVAGKTEEEVYKYLGLPWIAPELRENQGEIEAALSGRLPKLLEYNDIKGDLHCHSDWDGGDNSIEDIAQTAKDMGYEYVGIADHTKFLKIENGLDERQLRERNKHIDKLNLRFNSFKILKGCEANILNDGSLDIDQEALEELDFVIAGIHSSLKMQKEEMTARLIRAMKNPNIDIISHPTGRIIQKRDESRLDMDKIFGMAGQLNVVLEINSCPDRLDLKDTYIRRARDYKVKMAINTDAHNLSHLKLMSLGISQARRGWAEKKDIINTENAEKLLSFFKN